MQHLELRVQQWTDPDCTSRHLLLRGVRDVQSFYSFLTTLLEFTLLTTSFLQTSMLIFLIFVLFILALLTDGEVMSIAWCGPKKEIVRQDLSALVLIN